MGSDAGKATGEIREGKRSNDPKPGDLPLLASPFEPTSDREGMEKVFFRCLSKST